MVAMAETARAPQYRLNKRGADRKSAARIVGLSCAPGALDKPVPFAVTTRLPAPRPRMIPIGIAGTQSAAEPTGTVRAPPTAPLRQRQAR